MDIESQAELALQQIDEQVRARLTRNLRATVENELGITVQPVTGQLETRKHDGTCDGFSYLKDDVLLFVETPGSKREYFTIAHEVGHFLVERHPTIYNWIADQREPGKVLEMVCDAIAGKLLVPQDVIATVVGSDVPRAVHVIELFTQLQASRPVCAIALAQRLPGLGAVTILDRDQQIVEYASVRINPSDGWPVVYPWRGQSLSKGSPLLRIKPGYSDSRRITWSNEWGSSADYYIDALADERRVFVVFSERDLWNAEAFHGEGEREYLRLPYARGFCCGKRFDSRRYPCPRCRQPYCPDCGKCQCDRDRGDSDTCKGCHLEVKRHQLVDGYCEECQS